LASDVDTHFSNYQLCITGKGMAEAKILIRYLQRSADCDLSSILSLCIIIVLPRASCIITLVSISISNQPKNERNSGRIRRKGSLATNHKPLNIRLTFVTCMHSPLSSTPIQNGRLKRAETRYVCVQMEMQYDTSHLPTRFCSL
jgi:hypothetical protein